MSKDMTAEETWYPVEYAGCWSIQDEPYYEGANILDAANVGEEKAKQNAELAASAPKLQRELFHLQSENTGLKEEIAIEKQTADNSLEIVKELEDKLKAMEQRHREMVEGLDKRIREVGEERGELLTEYANADGFRQDELSLLLAEKLIWINDLTALLFRFKEGGER